MALNFVAWLIFVAAAVLEVGGDALIRAGLRGERLPLIAAGVLALGSYGVFVNTVRWDFASLLGVYVAVFACTSVLFGRFVFGENVPPAIWFGLSLIVAGGLVIQLGR